MIDVKSLRISNLVYSPINKQAETIFSIGPSDSVTTQGSKFPVSDTAHHSYSGSDCLSPIPLSEGLLVAAKRVHYHDQIGNEGYWALSIGGINDGNVGMLIITKYPTGGFYIHLGRGMGKVVETVHEFQNFIFSFCGEELSFDLSLVGAGLNQPPTAEAIRDADFSATQDEYEPYFGWCDVDGCNNEGCSGGTAWRSTGYWTVCSKHSKMFRDGAKQPKMKQAAIDKEATRLPDGCLPAPSDSVITSESREASGGKPDPKFTIKWIDDTGANVECHSDDTDSDLRRLVELTGIRLSRFSVHPFTGRGTPTDEVISRLKAENEKLKELAGYLIEFRDGVSDWSEFQKHESRISELRSQLGLG